MMTFITTPPSNLIKEAELESVKIRCVLTWPLPQAWALLEALDNYTQQNIDIPIVNDIIAMLKTQVVEQLKK